MKPKFGLLNLNKMIAFDTKATTLKNLSSKLQKAMILPQLSFSVQKWFSNKNLLINLLDKKGWLEKALIVRSSSKLEDSINKSLAGKFTSVLDVLGKKNIIHAIEKVIKSYPKNSLKEQILIQPFLKNVILSGVAFSKDPNTNSPYIVLNYDEISGSTDSVTTGYTNNLKTYYFYKHSTIAPPKHLKPIIELIFELEKLFQTDSIDIEYAFTNTNIFLLQVRPLIIKKKNSQEIDLNNFLDKIFIKIKNHSKPHPYLYGKKTIFGVMPDWNPAEIIGIRPKPLALSLYKEVITNNIWAYQRNNYGYRNLRSFPLLIDFFNLPYIDVRTSFNSFIPETLNDELGEKLVNFYLNQLEKKPQFHDKVEFEIIFSCYTFDIKSRIKILENHNFSKKECGTITEHLCQLTNKIIDKEKGLCLVDKKKIDILKEKYLTITNSSLDNISKIYWLLEDCKRYGTLPFAGLARAGFIAVQMLKSLIHEKVLNLKDYNNFFKSLNTISSQMSRDLKKLNKEDFLKIYGHLRPGTYDILSPRYDEQPDLYFDWKKKSKYKKEKNSFNLSLKQMKKIQTLLKNHNLNHDIISFFEFIKNAIIGREYAKFIFTKNLSEVLKIFYLLAKENKISKEDCSYANINCIKNLYTTSSSIKNTLINSIKEEKQNYDISKNLVLPPIITKCEDIYSFYIPNNMPNYITLKKAKGPVFFADMNKNIIKNSILFITNADPGFDWIFSHNIKGFITMYGGINSHMAIRAQELNIPAIIGSGKLLFDKWSKAKIIEIDCCNKQVNIVQ